MRILHILDHSIPLHSGYTFRTAAILREQHALGWETFHLTSPKQGETKSMVEEVEGLRFHRTGVPTPARSGIAELRQIRAVQARIEQLAAELRPGIPHAHSPVLNAIPAIRAGRKLRIPVVYEIRAFWEDAAVDHGTTTEGSLRYRATKALETWAIKRADHVFTICEGLRADIVGRGIPAAKVTVIPNAVDIESFQLSGDADPALREQLGLAGTTVVGFVGSFPIPEVIRNINAYTLGAQSVNPKIKTKVVWVNSWYDPAKERQAAETLIAQGADVLAQNTDSPAIVQTAQEKGKYAFGWDTDMKKFGPKSQLAASVINWGGYYTRTAKAVLANNWKSDSVDWGVKDGMVDVVSVNPAVPKPLLAKFDAKKAQFAAGKFHSFTGPIVDQAGKTMVAAGQVLPQKGVDTMNWYVKGVEGSIPK